MNDRSKNNKEDKKMPVAAKKEQACSYENFPLSLDELKKHSISPKLEKGKIILDKNNPKERDFYKD